MLDVITISAPGRVQVFFNISGNVGLKSRNDVIDVQLVQLGYACSAINPLCTAPADVKAVYAKVKPGTPYRGTADDPLTQAIAMHEKFMHVTGDGHISRMAGGQVRYMPDRAKAPYLLSCLCNNISDVLRDCYPRIDRSSRCPAELSNHVRTLLWN